jgi:HTH-type transcriptional regulator/antitoxin HigA
MIAPTLRHDRVDNFGFTLHHEIAHVSCHLSSDTSVILGDLDVNSSDDFEAQADEFASSPGAHWHPRSYGRSTHRPT